MLRVGDIIYQVSSRSYFLVYEITDKSYNLHRVGDITSGSRVYLCAGCLRISQYNALKYPLVGRGTVVNKALHLEGKELVIDNKFKVKYRK